MTKLVSIMLAGAVLSVAVPAGASVIYATAATLGTAWSGAKAGDTIRLSGSFGLQTLQYKTSNPPITIDATKATFTDSLKFNYVTGVKVIGGTFDSRAGKTTYGRAIVVYNSSNMLFDKQSIIGPTTSPGQGISLNNVDNVSVTHGSFTSLGAAVGVSASKNVTLASNTVVGSTSDGFDVAGSHMVTVANNSCSGGAPAAGAHPDCVQLWSINGAPVQSDITIVNNIATGNTQGFDSFTPQWGGGLRITITGNIVNNTYAQGIACYGCVDSSFTDNFLVALPTAPHFTNLNIIGGSDNLIANNTFASTAQRRVLPTTYAEAYLALTGHVAGAAVAYDTFGSSAYLAAAVPEPGAWAMLIAGFAFVGSVLRARRRSGGMREVAA